MDPLSIAAAAAVAKAATHVTEGALSVSGRAGRSMVDWLRSKLPTSKELDLVEQAPDSASAVDSLARLIEATITSPADREHLGALVNETTLVITTFNQQANGDGNIQASNSTVTVNRPQADRG